MKNNFTFFLILFFILGLLPINYSNASSLATRLKGKILLQVESNGEAWYIYPENEKRYYLGRPTDAFQVMRDLGLGISNKDFDSFNNYAPSRLSGKILLKVEDSGKAYYVNPADLKMHYLGRPADAFQIMRELGLGISNDDLFEITTNDSYNVSSNIIKSKLNKGTAYKAIVRIACVNENLDMIKGSGVIVSPDGKILTNAHVTSDSNNIYSKYDCYGCIATKDNSYDPDYCFNINRFHEDNSNDLAFGIIQNDFQYQRNILINDVEDMDEYPFLNIELDEKVGDTVYAIGYPTISNGSANTTKGMITSKTIIDDFDFLISDVGVSYGNSGGAVINQDGKLLGLATQVNYDELMSLTYIIDMESLKQEMSWLEKVRSVNPYDNSVNFDRTIYFIEDVYTINGIK